MIVQDSISWPLVFRVDIPTAGGALVGTVSTRSPDLEASIWAAESGTLAVSGQTYSGWENPKALAFYATGASASATIALNLGSTRGLAVYLGYSQYANKFSDSLAVYQASQVKFEFLDGTDATISSLVVKPSAGANESYVAPGEWSDYPYIAFDVTATVGGLPHESPGVFDRGQLPFRSVWHRTAALAIDPYGNAEMGALRPALRGSFDEFDDSDWNLYRGEIRRVACGTAPLETASSVRVTTTGLMGMAYIEIRKQGLRDVDGSSDWWRNRVLCVEHPPTPEQAPPTDWTGVV